MTLSIKNISKHFGENKAVDDLNINIPEGEIFGLLGGNGAGKTTTFRMILGLITPTNGTVTYQGKKINYRVTDNIGYLPEERGLHPKLKVREQIQYLGKLKGMSSKQVDEQLDYWLERFEVPENKNKKIEKLSKGNQQKIQVIASIIHNPSLIILDEPFSGLDPINVEILKKAVIDLKNDGATIIFSTHRMEHVEELCENVCILNKGRSVVAGNIDQIKSDFGQKEIVVESDHDLAHIERMPGIVEFKQVRKRLSIKIADESYAEPIFNEVIKQGYVKRFEVKEPSMNDIFIAKVGEKFE